MNSKKKNLNIQNKNTYRKKRKKKNENNVQMTKLRKIFKNKSFSFN